MSADLTLPDTFDVIVCGTGLTESMVAASLSRIGKKVLHIDRCDYYGSHWGTFTFESLQKWIQRYQNPEFGSTDENRDPNTVPRSDVCITNICVRSYIAEKTPTHESEEENIVGEKSDAEKVEAVKSDDSEKADCDTTTDDVKLLEKNDSMKNDDDSITDDANKTEIDKSKGKTENNDSSDQTSTENSASQELDLDPSLVNFVNPPKPSFTKPMSMISQARIKQNSADVSLDDFIVLSRKFNLDITTKFLFSAGPLVNAIIKANISHYAEFKVVNRILTWKEDTIMEVPCNRADVFGSSFLTMIEKRMLMKFITQCLEYNPDACPDDIAAYKGKPFNEFLESRKLSENLRKFVIYSIALVKPDTPTEIALVATHKFLKSLGRYGKSPFIWPLYGIGELPQAFCRMSAVFGGTYCLKLDIETIEVATSDSGKVNVRINGQTITSDHIVMEGSYVPYKYDAKSSGKMVSRGILITNQSLLPTAEEHLSFLTIPPLLGHEESVRVIEVGPASSACPSGLFVLYLTCESSYGTAEEDLLQYTTLLAARNGEDNNKPKLLWSLYFNQLEDVIFEDTPDNMFIPSLPDSTLGFDKAVEEAERIFHAICPTEEFMLAVPNSEDIIWGSGTEDDKASTTELENKVLEENMIDPPPPVPSSLSLPPSSDAFSNLETNQNHETFIADNAANSSCGETISDTNSLHDDRDSGFDSVNQTDGEFSDNYSAGMASPDYLDIENISESIDGESVTTETLSRAIDESDTESLSYPISENTELSEFSDMYLTASVSLEDELRGLHAK